MPGYMILHRLGRISLRAWSSPTLTTWGSLMSRLGGSLILLPLVLHTLPQQEFALWLLFLTAVNLQVLADVGFSQTFVRAISNARGGAVVSDLSYQKRKINSTQIPATLNTETLSRVISSLAPIYFRLSLICFLLMAILGTSALYTPINGTVNPSSGWLAWILVIAATSISIRGNVYTAYLVGMEQIANLRRWETLFSVLGILTAVLILLSGGTLLALVAGQQFWIVAAVLRNRHFCNQNMVFRENQRGLLDREVLTHLWPSAWRSGVGILMSFGIIQSSGFVYAQVATSVELASYLLGLRIIQLISQISQAPFYSKIPLLSRLYSEGKRQVQIQVSKRGMALAHATYLIAFLIAGVASPYLLTLIGTETDFPSPSLWTMMGLAFFAERVGAMHLQLYSTTNHIIWHTANGVTGIVMLLLALPLYRYFGVIGFPLAMLVSYSAVYCVIACSFSYRKFQLDFRRFDLMATLAPFLVTATIWSCYLLGK